MADKGNGRENEPGQAPGRENGGKSAEKGNLPCLNIPMFEYKPDTLFVHVLPHFRGDTIIVQVPNLTLDTYTNIIIDVAGFDEEFFQQYFERFNITSFDYLFITHPHNDHIKGVQPLLAHFVEKKGFKKPVICRTMEHPGEVYRSFALRSLDTYLVANNYTIITMPDTSENINVGGIKFEFIGPSREFLEKKVYIKRTYNRNNASLVFSLKYSGSRLLFTGDAELEEWKHGDGWVSLLDTLGKPKNLIDRTFIFMKLAHHGSQNGTPPLRERNKREINLEGAFAIATPSILSSEENTR